MAKGFAVATILINNQQEIYDAINQVKSKEDLPKVTKVVTDILNKNEASIRDKVAMKKCIQYLEIAQDKTIAAYTGTLVTYMGGGKI